MPLTPSFTSSTTPPDLVAAVLAIRDKKGEDLRVLDLTGLTSISDYFVICSGRSTRQNQTIAAAVIEALGSRGARPLSHEGHASGRWILLDYVDFVVNVFLPEVRAFYGLERLWADAEELQVDGHALPARRSVRKSQAKES